MPRTHSRGRLQKTGSAGAQGSTRFEREGFLSNPAHMAPGRPHLAVAQPNLALTGVEERHAAPPPHPSWGGEAHSAPPLSPPLPLPVSNPGIMRHPPGTAGLAGAGAGGGEGRAGRGRGGDGGPMCTICTTAGKPANYPLTAFPLIMCHRRGRAGYIQRHCLNSNVNKQTTAARE